MDKMIVNGLIHHFHFSTYAKEIDAKYSMHIHVVHKAYPIPHVYFDTVIESKKSIGFRA